MDIFNLFKSSEGLLTPGSKSEKNEMTNIKDQRINNKHQRKCSLSLPLSLCEWVLTLTIVNRWPNIWTFGEIHVEDLVVDILWAGLLTGYDMRVPIVTDAATSEVYLIGEAIYSFKRSPAVDNRKFFSYDN